MIMKINQVGILGSGVMGAQIAAVFANANIPTLLFGYEAHVEDNLSNIISFKPKALTHPSQQAWITPVSFEKDLDRLIHCDLVIEAIIEDLDAKHQDQQHASERLYRGQKVIPNLIPKVRMDIACNDEFVDVAIEAILKSAKHDGGRIGDGKIFVTELKRCIRIRTEESGGQAI